MALTDAQEAKLLQIISAFENGKRLSDLPEVTGTNPFELYTEVLDTDGERKKAALASLLPYLEEQCAYGVEIDLSISNPNTCCTRVGKAELHRTLPIHNRLRGCLLNDDGSVNEYLNPLDWTGPILDGPRGQVMVELPPCYARFTALSATKVRVMFSEFPLPGYQVVRRQYVSADEATIDRTTASKPKLAAVVNNTEAFRGGNNNAAWDGTYRSLLGQPATATSRTDFRAYARNRGAAGHNGAGWNCMTYDIQKILYWLFVVEYCTLNSQADYNPTLTAEGYHQGGLGVGVSGLDGGKWNTYNSYYPFIPCGYTHHLGNQTGVVDFTMPEEYGQEKVVPVPRYRGIQNPFGHIWQWTDGINVRINPTEENGGNGRSEVFVCSDPALFKDTNYDGYHYVGDEARNNDYVKQVIFGEGGEIMPLVCGNGAGSTTYFCDYHYTDIPTTTALRGVLFGGFANNGASCGFAYACSSSAPSLTNASFGSRLCFIPA